MIQYFLCPDMISFFATRNELSDLGYLYIKHKDIEISQATNYVKLDTRIGVFSLCTGLEYKLNN